MPVMTEPARGKDAQHRVFHTLDAVNQRPYTLREYARRFLWDIVQRTLIALSPRRAGGWRRFWLRAFGARLHRTSLTKPSTRVFHPWLFEMGEYSTLAEGVVVYNLGPIRIGRHSVVSQEAYLCAGTHDYTKPNLPLIRPTIEIGDGVWVCARAFVGPGVRVGNNSVVGACAVVIRDVPPGVIAGGNPARVIRDRPMDWSVGAGASRVD